MLRRIRGTSFPTFTPGDSARRRCNASPLSPFAIGLTASTNTSTPIPPSHTVKLRQYKRLTGSASTSAITLAPVVVKPETVSKKASTNDDTAPLRQNGSAPNTERSTHERPTVTKPSRA